MPGSPNHQRTESSVKAIDIKTFSCILLTLLSSSIAFAAPRAFEQGMNALLEGNFAEAYCQWKPLAHRGHAEAQYNLGWLYANGNGLNVDMDAANRWWQAAAEQGHADAQFAIGLALTTGEGGRRDLKSATHWFLRAAHQGHRDSREILSRLNADPGIDLLAAQPQLLNEPWFGWAGVIAGDSINVREKPSTKSKIVAKLAKNHEVRVLGRRGDWLQVVLNTESGPQQVWIYHSLVKPKKS